MFSFADTLAVSKTNEYFDLSSTQKEDLRKSVREDLNKVKKDFMPEVAKSLRKVEAEVQKDKMDSEVVAAHFLEFQDLFKKLTSYFADTAAKTSVTFTSEQFDHYATAVREEIQERNNLEDQNENIYKRYRRSLEFWMGGMSQDQKDKIHHFLELNPYPTKLLSENQEYLLKKFLEVKTDKEKLKVFVKTYWLDYESLRLPTYTEALNHHKKAFQKFLAEDFWLSVTKTQKETLTKNLIARAEELENL